MFRVRAALEHRREQLAVVAEFLLEADLRRLRMNPLTADRSKSRSTNGYVAMPLDGLWLTGSFLHNGNAGHAYGTELPDPAKRALLEFLKTLQCPESLTRDTSVRGTP